MGVKISQLDPLSGGLTKYDKFEIEKNSDGKSYSCSGQDIKDYAATANNGAFKGTVNKDANSFTIEDIGVWNWSGANGPSKVGGGTVTSGIMEIISYVSAEDANTNSYTLIQRVTDGPGVYQRTILDGVNQTAWQKLTTRNSTVLDYGNQNDISSGTHVAFHKTFSSAPFVSATPTVAADDYVYIIRVSNVTNTGFDVTRHKSSTVAIVVNETTTVHEDATTGDKTTTTTTLTTRGAWETCECAFNWFAAHDED